MKRFAWLSLPLAVTAFTATMAEPAGAAAFKVEYGVSITGVPVGKLNVSGVVGARGYEIQAEGKLTGLVGLFASGKGGAAASGALRNGGGPGGSSVTRSTFHASVELGESKKVVRIDTKGGDVTALSMEPPMDERPGRLPLLPEHKRAVIDPLSAFLMPMRGAGPRPEDCGRTIPVFDGGSRLNIVMSYAETKQVELAGYKGPVLVCHVRYVPLAGHRPYRRVIKYMEQNRDMSVWLAPVGGATLLAPLKVSVKTIIGTATLEARKWQIDAGAN